MTSWLCLYTLSYGSEVGTPDEVGTLPLIGKHTCKQSVTSLRLRSIGDGILFKNLAPAYLLDCLKYCVRNKSDGVQSIDLRPNDVTGLFTYALSYGSEVGTPDEVGTLPLIGKRTCKQSVTSLGLRSIVPLQTQRV